MDTGMLFEELWPNHRPTSLRSLPALAREAGVHQVWVKCEGERPLGSFKSLGGLTAAIRALAKHLNVSISALLSSNDFAAPDLICATDGNHGLAVAAAGALCGVRARIYLPESANPKRADRIAAQGADVIRVAGTYDDAVSAALQASRGGEGLLISDTTADENDAVVSDVMSGYGLLTQELLEQLMPQAPPTHVFVQAGVGGLAAAVAQTLFKNLPQVPCFIVVEPNVAACVRRALECGAPSRIDGSLDTVAEMLSCGVASAPALTILRRHAVDCLSIDEDDLLTAPRTLRRCAGPLTTPSGAAGLAGLMRIARDSLLREQYCLTRESRVLLIVTEGPIPS